MSYWVGGLISFAASAAFLLVDHFVLTLAPALRWLGAAIAFLFAVAVLWLIHYLTTAKKSSDTGVLVDNEFGDKAEVEVIDSDLRGTERDVLSRNKVAGETRIRVKGSKL